MKALCLMFCFLLLFGSCSKDLPSHPYPGGRPAGLGTATFGFYLSPYIFQVDSLKVYCGSKKNLQIYVLEDTVFSFKTQWKSPEFAYQSGDSIWADIQAWGTLKESISSKSGIGKLSFDTVYWYDALPVKDSVWMDSLTAADTFSGTPFTYRAFKSVKF